MKIEAPKRHLITAALPYANGPIHIGHVAGAYLPPDIYVRYLRLKKEDVVFICGSDEHGAAITLRAKKEGISPKEIVDRYHELNQKAFQDLGISFDIFHRTTTELHHETAADFFKTLEEKGAFSVQTSEQFFDEQHQQFLADRYITGTCPKCGHENAYGDQCENCGSSLSPKDLINPISTLSGKKPVLKQTTHWYLPMQHHEKWLKQWIELGILEGKQQHNPMLWRNQVIGQCKSWIDNGLQPRAMTRDLDWGVKVPLENAQGKVLYVWLDAPIGYISATKEWAAQNEKDWKSYWQSEDTSMIHFIGKDNIVFHAIIFPIILKEHGQYILPRNVVANEFLNLEGKKISTSRNWAVWLHEYLADFPNGQDVLRYVLCSIAPESKDSEFTWKDFQARNNNELVAILGNFVNRSLVLTHKYFDGEVPERQETTSAYKQVVEELQQYANCLSIRIEKFQFREALAEAMNMARLGNKYLADTEPWKLIKTDKERVKTILHLALQITANLSIALEPFLPQSMKKLRDMLNIKDFDWGQLGDDHILKSGQKIEKAALLFAKIEDEVIERQIGKLQKSIGSSNQAAVEESASPEIKPEIQFDDFQKLDIRIGTILAAEKLPKSKKLLKLRIDVGNEERTILSGIAEYFQPDALIGQQVPVLLNLAPRKMMGILSEGMVLMGEDEAVGLTMLSPQKGLKNGSIIS